jgi:uncharacterized lipoprotein YmbA
MKTFSSKSARRWLAILPFLVQACTVLAPRQDPSRYFILTAAPGGSPPEFVAGDHQIAVGVGPVSFPGYLKRTEMVTRVDADRVKLSTENRWAEPLDSNFQRVLCQDLAQTLGIDRVVQFPWYGNPQIDYQVEVQVHRFDTDEQGRSQLSANWLIKDGHSGAVLFATETTTNSDAASRSSDESAALSRDVESFSRQIGEQISKLNQARSREASSRSSRFGQSTPRSQTGRAASQD